MSSSDFDNSEPDFDDSTKHAKYKPEHGKLTEFDKSIDKLRIATEVLEQKLDQHFRLDQGTGFRNAFDAGYSAREQIRSRLEHIDPNMLTYFEAAYPRSPIANTDQELIFHVNGQDVDSTYAPPKPTLRELLDSSEPSANNTIKKKPIDKSKQLHVQRLESQHEKFHEAVHQYYHVRRIAELSLVPDIGPNLIAHETLAIDGADEIHTQLIKTFEAKGSSLARR